MYKRKNQARHIMFQNNDITNNVAKFQRLRRGTNKLLRRKKRKFHNAKLEELKRNAQQNNIKDYYRSIATK